MTNVDLAPRLLDVRGVAQAMMISERTIWKLVKLGRFPAPIHIGRTARWHAEDVARYIKDLTPRSISAAAT